MPDPFVVVGGDAAGLSAASKLKRDDPDREVVVFERGQWVSFAHCGMPYYVEGKVEDLTDLLSLTPEQIEDRGIDLRRGHEVVAVSPDDNAVTVEADGERFDQPYGELLVATGGRAVAGPFSDALTLDGAFTLHHMDSAAAVRAFLTPPAEIDPESVDAEFVDRDLVREYADQTPPDSVAVVGGGYVGVEMAEALSAWDIDVSLFQRDDHVLPAFGPEVGEVVEDHLREQGVSVHTNATVTEILGTDRVTGVRFDGDVLDVQMALVGVGIRPNTELLDGTGIELGDSGAVATDEYGCTSHPDVFAAGDCAEMEHVVSGESVWVPLGLTANRAGRAIGQTVAGDPTLVGTVAGTAVVKAFDLETGRSGIIDHEEAREVGFDPVSETVTASSKSGYYPGAAETTVTLTADRGSSKLLGGSIVGADTAAKRIDTVATALESGLTVPELERLDLSYAPPFSPVWDPILVAAKVLNGRLEAEAEDQP
ncbi:FAD-dependent oxidoreductase [Halorussus halophilus]|uniref:FAD-dependent oxidoreductase n=1 Tax=Halorussus halophilus TaxID=2650975 RepID=UPI0013012686|nr:FAD-dependent oxidoreductase [Halorussus halophilus]